VPTIDQKSFHSKVIVRDRSSR